MGKNLLYTHTYTHAHTQTLTQNSVQTHSHTLSLTHTRDSLFSLITSAYFLPATFFLAFGPVAKSWGVKRVTHELELCIDISSYGGQNLSFNFHTATSCVLLIFTASRFHLSTGRFYEENFGPGPKTRGEISEPRLCI